MSRKKLLRASTRRSALAVVAPVNFDGHGNIPFAYEFKNKESAEGADSLADSSNWPTADQLLMLIDSVHPPVPVYPD